MDSAVKYPHQAKYDSSPKGRASKDRYQRSAKGKATKQAWFEKNKDQRLKKIREWEESHPKNRLLSDAKQRAKRRGLEFNLTLDDFEIPDVCPVFGKPLRKGTRGACDDAPSLDRVDSRKGYVPGNVKVVSFRANVLKNDATLEELEALVRYVRSAL